MLRAWRFSTWPTAFGWTAGFFADALSQMECSGGLSHVHVCIAILQFVITVVFRLVVITWLYCFGFRIRAHVYFCLFAVLPNFHAIVDAQNDWIKKWKRCVELVHQAQQQFRQHLQFKDLLAVCDRDANRGGPPVASSSSSSNAGASNKISQLALHRRMASLVRNKLIEMAKAGIEIVQKLVEQRRSQGNATGAAQQERDKKKLIENCDQLERTDRGWKIAWGIVDRALAGMKCFFGIFHILSLPPLNDRIIRLGYHM